MAAVALPANVPVSSFGSLIFGYQSPGVPSGVLFPIPFPLPFPFLPAAPAGAQPGSFVI